MKSKYITRIIDKKINEYLKSIGCLVIEGPRGCGKTTTAEHFSKTTYKLKDNDKNNELIEIKPKSVLEGDVPVLIDEWHNVPVIWDTVREEVDKRRKPGQFILTGSAAPKDNVNRHTGARRMGIVKMAPMSLFESSNSSSEVDFKRLFEQDKYEIFGEKEYSLDDYARFIVKGGWPSSLNYNEKEAFNDNKFYIENLSNTDLRRMTPKLTKTRIIALIRSISRNISTSVATDKIANEAKISRNSIRQYLDQLNRIYLLDELEAWSPHIRSKTRLKIKHKWFFCDPCIAAASLGITSNHLMNDREAMGLFFEAMALRDIRALANAVDGTVFYIADSKNDRGNEIDIIVELWDERWAAFEVKLGSDVGINEGVRNFEWLDSIISDSKKRKLMSKNILIAGGRSYKRKDGINIISLAHLFV